MAKQVETFEFRGKQAKITIETEANGWTTITYPCSATKSYGDSSLLYHHRKIDSYSHIAQCVACQHLLGLTKAKWLRTQQQVANLFGLGLDGFKTTGLKSENGFLLYYGNIRAVRTTKGIIVNSQLDRAGGGLSTVYVPKPNKNVIAELPLGTIRQITSRGDFGWMKEIEVLDQTKKEYWLKDALITAIGLKLLITRDTNGMQYVIELDSPMAVEMTGTTEVKTVHDALECLKPAIVRQHEKAGVKVLRQGEYFFIPTGFTDSEITDIQKVVRKTETRELFGGIETKTTLTFPTVDNQEDTHHRATRHGLFNRVDVVKGTVRHENRDHKMLRLPKNTWCIVAKNTAIRSLNVRGDPD